MQLTPRYGTDPLIVIEGDPGAVLAPVNRQRQRLVEAVSGFDDEAWAHPSRCEGWTNRDVITHLQVVNGFWSYAITMGLRGEPSRILADFDPVATPAQLVAGSPADSDAEQFDRFAASAEALGQLLESLDDDGWRALAEAPPGHLAVATLAHHALWDSWVHERDVLLPLGREQVLEADEVATALRYVAALGPAFACNEGSKDEGTLVVDVEDPAVAFTVEVGTSVAVRDGAAADADLVLGGPAVDLLEALSFRTPLRRPVPEGSAWMVQGLARAFDVPI